MARYALIKNDIIENIVEWDGVSNYNPGEDFLLLNVDSVENAVIGALLNQDGSFSLPGESLPLNIQLFNMYNQLPVALQAAFYPLKIAIEDALKIGKVEVAREIIIQATIPAEYEPLRTEMLTLFPE